MRIGKPTRATRSKAAVAASAPATVSASTEEVDKTNSSASAKSEEDAAGSAPSGAAVAATVETSAGDQEQVSEVRRTPRKRSQTKLYDAVEAAGGGSTKRQKRSARLASKERGCPNPWTDEDEPDEKPPEPVTEEAPPTIEAGHGKSAIHLSGKNMASWNNLRKEFGVKSDDKVFERLQSFVKLGLTQKTAKPDLR